MSKKIYFPEATAEAVVRFCLEEATAEAVVRFCLMSVKPLVEADVQMLLFPFLSLSPFPSDSTHLLYYQQTNGGGIA